VICIETERLSQDVGAQTFLFGFYQTLMKGERNTVLGLF